MLRGIVTLTPDEVAVLRAALQNTPTPLRQKLAPAAELPQQEACRFEMSSEEVEQLLDHLPPPSKNSLPTEQDATAARETLQSFLYKLRNV